MLAEGVEELRIIIFSPRGFTPEQISSKVWLYPTNSRNRWCYVFDAIKIGKSLVCPQVVTAQDPFESGMVAWWLARYHQCKLQLQIHTDVFNPHFIKRSFLNKIRVLLAKFLLPRASSIRVVSQGIKNSLITNLQISSDRINVLPVFIDLEKLKQAPVKNDLHKKYPQFEKIIFMASRLTPEKNIDLAIEAMAELVKKFPQLGLIIVGSGPEEQRLKLKTKTLALPADGYHLGSNIVFEPWTDDLVSYYKTADLFLNTSWYEGYGRTLVEALVCGCPVISTDVGVATEIGAIIINQDNIARVIENTLMNRMSEIADRDIYPYPNKQLYLKSYERLWTI